MQLLSIYKESFEGLNKDVWNFGFMMFINRLGTLILPFLMLYTTVHLGWSKVDAGTATMWFGIGSLCGAWLGGILADKIGYYRTMMISLFGASIVFFSLQFFTDFYLLCGALFVSSLVADLLRPALFTGLTFFTDKSTQTRAVSLLRMAFNLGLSIGPAIAGVLIYSYGYEIIFILDSLTCLGAFIYLIKYITNRQPKVERQVTIKSESKLSPWTDIPFLIYMLFCCFMLISFFQIIFTVPLFLNEVLGYSEKEIGWYFYGVNGMLIFIFEMPLVSYLEKTTSQFKAMKIGAFMIGLASLALVLPLPGYLLVAMYILLVSFGEIINFPFIASTSMNRAPKSITGKYMGANTMMFSISLILAPKIGTYLLDAFGYNILFITMFSICVLSNLGLIFVEKWFAKDELSIK
ncbi:MAG: MFS transporter [Saprospiraceae bacterium]